ncbi:hypothetical protein N665_4206s0005 [Sinapis alba]|nr:hypothetical protein N665_4206s0005 [Sinapis alba]
MIRHKDSVAEFLRCTVGDGSTASFWYDFWTDMGPLLPAFGERGPRDLRLCLDAKVAAAVVEGEWALPPARSDEAETLLIVLSTMNPPSPNRGRDVYLWRNGAGQFVPKFSAKSTWHSIREQAELVPWHSVVWFKEEIPRCSFVVWMAMLSRLPTRDRLSSWGMNVPLHCVLSTPPTLNSVAALISHPRVAASFGLPAVLKLLLQAIIYCIWRERNLRIFTATTTSEAGVFSQVDRLIRDRLISFPSTSAAAPSMLQVYYSLSFRPP